MSRVAYAMLMPEDDLTRVKHGVFWWRGAPCTPAGEDPPQEGAHRVRLVLLLRWVHHRSYFQAPDPGAPEPESQLKAARPKCPSVKCPAHDGGVGVKLSTRYAGAWGSKMSY